MTIIPRTISTIYSNLFNFGIGINSTMEIVNMGNKQESVKRISGQVGELGPHIVNPDHTAYDYIRMDVDGQAVMIRNVRVSQTVDSYLQPELDVTIYIHGADKQGNNGLVMAAEIDGKKINMADDLTVAIEGVSKNMRKLYWCIGISLLPVPVLPFLLLFSIPIILLIFMVLALLFVQKRKLKALKNEVTSYFETAEQPS
jgi:hypothetical protein